MYVEEKETFETVCMLRCVFALMEMMWYLRDKLCALNLHTKSKWQIGKANQTLVRGF